MLVLLRFCVDNVPERWKEFYINIAFSTSIAGIEPRSRAIDSWLPATSYLEACSDKLCDYGRYGISQLSIKP